MSGKITKTIHGMSKGKETLEQVCFVRARACPDGEIDQRMG
jgi:hypothetical protein